MKMRRAGWWGLAVMASVLFMAVPGRTEEVQLPESTAVYMRTAPLGELLTDLDTFLGAVVRGTPVQMFVPPGVVQTQLVEALGIPLETFDLAKGMHAFFFVNPEDMTDDPAFVTLLPVGDYAAVLARLGDLGIEVEDYATGMERRFGVEGDQMEFVGYENLHMVTVGYDFFAVADAGKGYAFVSLDPDMILRAQAALADWTIPGTLEGAHLEFVYQMETLHQAGLGEGLQEGVEEILVKLEDLDAAGLDIAAMVKPTLDIILKIAAEIKDARLRLHLSPEQITMEYDTTAKSGSRLAEIYNLHEKASLPMDLYTLLPAHTRISALVGKQPAATEWLRPRLRAFLTESLTPFDAGVAASIAEAYDAFMEHGGEVAMSGSFTNTGLARGMTLIRTGQPDAARAAYGALHQAADSLLNRILSLLSDEIGETLPMTFRIAYNQEAGTIEGVSHDEIKVDITLDEEFLKDKDAPEEALAAFNKRMESVKNNIEGLLAVMDDIFIVAEGADADAALKDMILALRGKTARLGENESLMQTVNRHIEAGGISIFTMDMIAIIKAGAMDAITNIEDLDPQGTNTIRMMIQAIREGGTPLVASLRPKTDGMQVRIEIPVREINSLITNGAQIGTAYMMMMQRQMQRRFEEMQGQGHAPLMGIGGDRFDTDLEDDSDFEEEILEQL